MAGSDIPSTPADGNTRTDIILAGANLAALTVAELTAGTAVSISCYLTPGGFAGGIDQATIADPRECSLQEFGAPGRTTPSLSITGIDNSNSSNDAAFNALVDVLVQNAQRYAVRRPGIPFDTAWVAGQEYMVWPFAAGFRQEIVPEANAVQRAMWACFVNGTVTRGVVAGVAPVPRIDTALPSGAAVGAQVTLKGDYFTGVTAITFGAVSAPIFTVVNASTIVVNIPAGTAGSAPILVTTPAGVSISKAYTRGA